MSVRMMTSWRPTYWARLRLGRGIAPAPRIGHSLPYRGRPVCPPGFGADEARRGLDLCLKPPKRSFHSGVVDFRFAICETEVAGEALGLNDDRRSGEVTRNPQGHHEPRLRSPSFVIVADRADRNRTDRIERIEKTNICSTTGLGLLESRRGGITWLTSRRLY